MPNIPSPSAEEVGAMAAVGYAKFTGKLGAAMSGIAGTLRDRVEAAVSP